jgi:transcriptional regulator of acetoin/glycerol metabolism
VEELADDLADDSANKFAAMPHHHPAAVSAGQNLKELSRAAIRQTLEINHGNISATARHLGISRQTLYRKLND